MFLSPVALELMNFPAWPGSPGHMDRLPWPVPRQRHAVELPANKYSVVTAAGFGSCLVVRSRDRTPLANHNN